jgi:hypothetical protein
MEPDYFDVGSPEYPTRFALGLPQRTGPNTGIVKYRHTQHWRVRQD